MISIIPIPKIIEFNKYFSQGVLQRPLESIYATYFYYDLPEEQVTSIVCNLAQGHYFLDGNKRTSCIVLIILAAYNNLKLKATNDDLDEIIINLICYKSTIQCHARHLFDV